MQKTLLIKLCLFLFLAYRASAQSIVVSMPSADITHKGHLEYTHESQFNFWNKPAKWNNFNFFAYGISKNTELAFSLINIDSKGSKKASFGIGHKSQWQFGKKKYADWEIKLTNGNMIFVSLLKPDLGGWAYAHMSARLPKLRTRLTAGLSYGSAQVFGYNKYITESGETIHKQNRAFSIIAAVEQPITERLSFMMDWFSGEHELAALSPAFQYRFSEKINTVIGYKIANDRIYDQDALILELMLHF